MPWVGMMHSCTENLFYQSFLQVDVPTNGNRLTSGNTEWGKLNDQTLMYLDFSLGYWLYRNPRGRFLNALAPIFELHYTTTLEDADVVTISESTGMVPIHYHFVNWENRIDPFNFTVGLHALCGQTTLGFAGVFPFRGGENQLFDAELQIYLNRYF
jgi:hypothetical protein